MLSPCNSPFLDSSNSFPNDVDPSSPPSNSAVAHEVEPSSQDQRKQPPVDQCLSTIDPVISQPSCALFNPVVNTTISHRSLSSQHGIAPQNPATFLVDRVPSTVNTGDQLAIPVQYPPMPTDPVSNPPAGSIKIPATTRARGDSVSVKAENVSEARETRRHVQDSWIDAQLETVLKFNGVFIPTVTLFIIESYKWLSPDIGPQISQIPSPRPAASIVILNVLWLVSLELNITSTLFATSTLMLQWTRRYTQVPKSPRDHMHSRSYLFLCTLSVFLFLAGLVMFFFIIHKIVGIVVLIVLIAVGIFEAVYLVLLPVLTASAQSYSTISIRC